MESEFNSLYKNILELIVSKFQLNDNESYYNINSLINFLLLSNNIIKNPYNEDEMELIDNISEKIFYETYNYQNIKNCLFSKNKKFVISVNDKYKKTNLYNYIYFCYRNNKTLQNIL